MAIKMYNIKTFIINLHIQSRKSFFDFYSKLSPNNIRTEEPDYRLGSMLGKK